MITTRQMNIYFKIHKLQLLLSGFFILKFYNFFKYNYKSFILFIVCDFVTISQLFS